MTDPALCKGMKIVDSPVVSPDALSDLWEIIQAWKEKHCPVSNPPSATTLEGDGNEGQAKDATAGAKIRRGRDLGADTCEGAEQGLVTLRADDPGKDAPERGGETG